MAFGSTLSVFHPKIVENPLELNQVCFGILGGVVPAYFSMMGEVTAHGTQLISIILWLWDYISLYLLSIIPSQSTRCVPLFL